MSRVPDIYRGNGGGSLSRLLNLAVSNLARAVSLAGLMVACTVQAAGLSPVTYELTGEVVSVADGDTLSLRSGDASGTQRIRLASIDAPERSSGSARPGQPYGDAARRFLSARVAGKTVTLTCFEQDRYGRHICNVPDTQADKLAGTTTVNQALVAHGLAWVNMEAGGKFMRDDTLPDLQKKARRLKLGLWAEPEPVAPWIWRYRCWRKGQC